MSVWLREEVQALLRCQNVATNNGLAFSETELISAENTCGYEDMHARKMRDTEETQSTATVTHLEVG
jgi:hypothetical protein